MLTNGKRTNRRRRCYQSIKHITMVEVITGGMLKVYFKKAFEGYYRVK